MLTATSGSRPLCVQCGGVGRLWGRKGRREEGEVSGPPGILPETTQREYRVTGEPRAVVVVVVRGMRRMRLVGGGGVGRGGPQLSSRLRLPQSFLKGDGLSLH